MSDNILKITIDDGSLIEAQDELDIFGDKVQTLSPTPGLIEGVINYLGEARNAYAEARGIPQIRYATILLRETGVLPLGESVTFEFTKYEPKFGHLRQSVVMTKEMLCDPVEYGLQAKKQDDRMKEQARLDKEAAKARQAKKKLKEQLAVIKFAQVNGLTLMKDGVEWDGKTADSCEQQGGN